MVTVERSDDVPDHAIVTRGVLVIAVVVEA